MFYFNWRGLVRLSFCLPSSLPALPPYPSALLMEACQATLRPSESDGEFASTDHAWRKKLCPRPRPVVKSGRGNNVTCN